MATIKEERDINAQDINPKDFSANQLYKQYQEKGGLKSFKDFLEIANQIGLFQIIGAGQRQDTIQGMVDEEVKKDVKILGMKPIVALGAAVVTITLVASIIVIATRKGK